MTETVTVKRATRDTVLLCVVWHCFLRDSELV